MLLEAKDIKAEYDYYTGTLKVNEKGKIRIFKDVPESECDKLIAGLEKNPGTGYLHFNKFLSKYFDKESTFKKKEEPMSDEDYEDAWKQYKKFKSDEEWEKYRKDSGL